MKLYLFDDAVADGWAPFALTRPIGELRFGALLLRERLEAWTGLVAAGHLTRPWLSSYEEPDAPPAVEPDTLSPTEGRLLLGSRFVPADGSGLDASEMLEASREGPLLLVCEGEAVGCWLPPGTDTPDRDWLARPSGLAGSSDREVAGRLLEAPWDVVRLGAERTARDVARVARGTGSVRVLPDGVWCMGDEPLHVADGVTLEPGVVLDLRHGPIGLAERVEVRAGSRLEGPVWAGAGSLLLGGPISGLAAGPVSYLRGEVADVHTVGWVNKAHEGHLGHAVLGRWVNLGAGTTNSDLKNNYGHVRVGPPGRERDTGLMKLGSLVGDHVKTAIGTLLDTGTVVGAGSNLFGPGRPPRWVPPFAWGFGEGAGRYRREAFLATAATVMARRGVELTASARGWLGDVWDAAATDREANAAGPGAGRPADRPGPDRSKRPADRA